MEKDIFVLKKNIFNKGYFSSFLRGYTYSNVKNAMPKSHHYITVHV